MFHECTKNGQNGAQALNSKNLVDSETIFDLFYSFFIINEQIETTFILKLKIVINDK